MWSSMIPDIGWNLTFSESLKIRFFTEKAVQGCFNFELTDWKRIIWAHNLGCSLQQIYIVAPFKSKQTRVDARNRKQNRRSNFKLAQQKIGTKK